MVAPNSVTSLLISAVRASIPPFRVSIAVVSSAAISSSAALISGVMTLARRAWKWARMTSDWACISDRRFSLSVVSIFLLCLILPARLAPGGVGWGGLLKSHLLDDRFRRALLGRRLKMFAGERRLTLCLCGR